MFQAIIVAAMLNGEFVTLKPTDRFDTHEECMFVASSFAAAYNYEMSLQGFPAAGYVITCQKGADA